MVNSSCLYYTLHRRCVLCAIQYYSLSHTHTHVRHCVCMLCVCHQYTVFCSFNSICLCFDSRNISAWMFFLFIQQQSNEKRKKRRARHHHFLDSVRSIFPNSLCISTGNQSKLREQLTVNPIKLEKISSRLAFESNFVCLTQKQWWNSDKKCSIDCCVCSAVCCQWKPYNHSIDGMVNGRESWNSACIRCFHTVCVYVW